MTPPPLPIPKVDYVTLHVTLLATRANINPTYFNQTSTPNIILTTTPSSRSGTPPAFNSLTRHQRLPTGESVYKIFSAEEVGDGMLRRLFSGSPIPWVCRKTWLAYPRLHPISEFAPIELYPDPTEEAGKDEERIVGESTHEVLAGERGRKGKERDAGVWYTSGIESFISTMETSALSGRNVAALIARRVW